MPGLFTIAKHIIVQHANEQYRMVLHDGHIVHDHDPYECADEGCQICRDFFLDEHIDRAHDEGKEKV